MRQTQSKDLRFGLPQAPRRMLALHEKSRFAGNQTQIAQRDGGREPNDDAQFPSLVGLGLDRLFPFKLSGGDAWSALGI